jgi:COMPASS component SWD3
MASTTDRRPIVTKKKISPKLALSENVSDVFCLKFSPDSQLLAAGCGDGAIRIYNT